MQNERNTFLSPALLLALASFWLFTSFLTPLPGDNVNTRINLSSAIVRSHSFRIDPFHINTLDKAFVDGHYYSDKAPGVSFMTLPVAFIYNIFRPAVPDDPAFVHLSTTLAVSLPAAILVYLFFVFCTGVSRSQGNAFLLTVSLAFGTLFLPYSTLLYGHVTGVAISFGVFYIATMSKMLPRNKMLLSGFLCSWLVIVEYPMAVHSVILGLLLLADRENRKHFLMLLPGIISCAVALLLYNKAAFGDWFTIGYMHESWQEFQEGHSRGFAGLTYPRPGSLYQILLRPGMGLLFLSPFLVFAVPGFITGMQSDKWRNATLAAGAISLAGILINASHFVPMGGMAPGPRHLVTIIPYLVFLCSFFLEKRYPVRMGIFAGLALISIFSHVAITITDPQTPRGFDVPALEYSMQHILSGVLRPTWISNITGISDITVVAFCLAVTATIAAAVYWQVKSDTHTNPAKALAWSAAACAISLCAWAAAYQHYSGVEPVKKKYLLAYSYRLLGRKDLAYKGYEEVLELHPSHALANFGLGKLALDKADLETAIKHFRATVDVYPTLSEAQYTLAFLLFNAGEYEEAYNRFVVSIDTEKLGNTRQIARAYAALAAISQEWKQPDNATALMGHANRIFPGDPFVKAIEQKMKEKLKEPPQPSVPGADGNVASH